MKLLPNEQQASYEDAKSCFICLKDFEGKYIKDKKYCKVRYHCHYTDGQRDTAHSICNLKYNMPKEITVIPYTGLPITMILSNQNQQKKFTDSLLVQEKIMKNKYSFMYQQIKKLQELMEIEKKLQKPYPTD